jgi:hypothetical protein
MPGTPPRRIDEHPEITDTVARARVPRDAAASPWGYRVPRCGRHLALDSPGRSAAEGQAARHARRDEQSVVDSRIIEALSGGFAVR